MGTNFYEIWNICSTTRRVRVCLALSILILSTSFFPAYSQTSTLSFSQITNAFPAPGRGAEQWGTTDWDNINVPYIPAGNPTSTTSYQRFVWGQIETAQGVYDFYDFDNYVKRAIAKNQMFSFGIMTMCTACSMMPTYGYPTYLHNLMQAESQPDWQNSQGTWVPNWNSPSYLSRYAAFNNALAAHINSMSYNGVPFKNVIYTVEPRGYGDFGEWHTYPWTGTEPAGRAATTASLKAIVDAVKNAFPNNQLVIPMAAFDTDNGHSSRLPAEFGYYVLTTSNNFGQIGWRRDNFGDPGYNDWLTNSPGTYNGNSFTPLIMNKYKYAPIGGEPNNGLAAVSTCGSPYCDLVNEVNLFHVSSFGNGNYPGLNVSNILFVNNILAAAKASGYRLLLTGGSMTTNLSSGGAFNISLNWQNAGNAPVYENWNVVYELRDAGGKVAWTGNSSFKPRLFLPGPAATASDNLTLGTVASGTYSMYLIVKDPVNYKKPLPLAISGRNSDGSYLLRSNITVGAGNGNKAPAADAGGNQTITLPTSSVSLKGTGTDTDGSIASYTWAKVSGPAGGTIASPSVANTNITGLAEGVYVFSLTVTDNQGLTGTANAQITVNPAAPVAVNQAPVANAGSAVTLTLPADSTTLNGSSSSDPDGSVASYAWSWINGPAQYSFSNATSASTALTNLVTGTYSFRLKVTDNDGATAMDTVKVTVNAASQPNQPPVANAGAAVTLTLPADSTTLNGSSSSDSDGSISSYAWAIISGPTQFSIANKTSASTALTALVAGVYSFQLKVTDNDGATALDTVKITVNAASQINQSPVANAGTDISLTLPTNVTNLTGSASSDKDGSIATYTWTKISGPTQFTIASAGTANTSLSSLVAGVYAFQLKITDNDGATDMDTVKVTVNAAPAQNQVPIANAGAGIVITLPVNAATLNGSASQDPDGTIVTYDWNQISGPSTAGIDSSSASVTNISGLQRGVYLFTLQVTDNDGAKGLDTVTITVNKAVNRAPNANAGNGKTVTLPTNSVSLDGSLSSDPDGSISNYSWTQISGPDTSTISNASAATATATNLVPGQYTFGLTVTDNDSASASAQVKITVVAAGVQPPVANAGANQSITLPVDSVSIDGSASSSSTGSIVSYVWKEGSGPSSVTLANAAQNDLDNLQAGVYIFYLTVTDNNAATATDSVIIAVKPPVNKAPVASAGSGYSITLPKNTATLDGSKSYDPDGTISSYTWTRISGPNAPAITGANTETLNISGLIAGQYTYSLMVKDNSGASSSAQVKITVVLPPNVSPYASAGSNQTITAPASTVNLDGSDSYDPDGALSTYSWVKISGPGSITISNSNTATPSVSGLVTGSYILELTVTDNGGASAKDQVTVTVNPKPIQPNQLPIANAGSNLTITIPQNSIALDGKSSFDPDGTITGYSWAQVSGPSTAGITGGNTVTATVSNLVVGQYIFELTVKDNNGAADKDQVTVNVNPAVLKANQAPIANAGTDTTISLPFTAYVLDASGSNDPDGTIASYQWEETSGPNTVTSSSMDNSKVSIGEMQEGEYVFQVTVTDNSGISSSAKVKITVEAAATDASSDRLIVYPNPARYVINEQITSAVTGTTRINIYDMNGQLVQSDQVEKSGQVVQNRTSIQQLASGVYTIQINIGNKKQMVSKFIKR